MSESQTQLVGTYVRANTPLRTLYIVGALALILGMIITLAAAGTAWLFLGYGLAGFGGFALVGAAMAHAINWQILNR